MKNLMQQAEPILELYDLTVDPGETNNLFQSKPKQAARLRKQYDDWFSEVQKTRNFTPGTIVIDKTKENPSVLCRYQDGRLLSRSFSRLDGEDQTVWFVSGAD